MMEGYIFSEKQLKIQSYHMLSEDIKCAFHEHYFFDTLYGVSFALLKSNSPLFSFVVWKRAALTSIKSFLLNNGEYIMILYIYSCTVPLNMH